MNILLFLHFYQPPYQQKKWLDRIAAECYAPLGKMLAENPNIRITANFAGSLLELWYHNGFETLINLYATLIKRGQIELVSSAAYHAFLPKLTQTVIKDQIKTQEKILTKYFNTWTIPQGFFPPEMAVDPIVLKSIQKMQYQYCFVDQYISKETVQEYVPIAQTPDKMRLIVRHRGASVGVASGAIDSVAGIHLREPSSTHIVLALDAETFGHQRAGLIEKLANWQTHATFHTVSTVYNAKETYLTVNPRANSWSILSRERIETQPFIRWDDKDNKLHILIWRLMRLAIQVNKTDLTRVRGSLASCVLWWASARPWWSIELIEQGIYALKESIPNSKIHAAARAQAEYLYTRILTEAYAFVRSGKMQSTVDAEIESLHYDNTQSLI